MNWILLCFTISFIILDNTMKTDSACAGSGGGSGGGSGMGIFGVLASSTTPPVPQVTFPMANCNIKYNTIAITDEQVSPEVYEENSEQDCCNHCAYLGSDCMVFLYMPIDHICLLFGKLNMTGITTEELSDVDFGFVLD